MAKFTEDHAMAWERERHSWNTDAGTAAIDTVDSNLWVRAVAGVASSSWRPGAPT